jgi:hypothetical protein
MSNFCCLTGKAGGFIVAGALKGPDGNQMIDKITFKLL